MSLSMSFYGIIFGVSALSGNVFLNMFLLSVAEVPLTLLTDSSDPEVLADLGREGVWGEVVAAKLPLV
ncbi:hypothetical protein ACOMHN_059716 [Nucella lapillus]